MKLRSFMRNYSLDEQRKVSDLKWFHTGLLTLFFVIFFVITNLIADDAADCGTADRTERAATSKNRASDGTCPCPDRRVSIPC